MYMNTKILKIFIELKEGLEEARRQFEIYMFLQRFHARNQKITEIKQVL